MATLTDRFLGTLVVDDDGSCAEGVFVHRGLELDVFVPLDDVGRLPAETDLCGGPPGDLIDAAVAAARSGSDESVELYVSHHLAELDADELAAILGDGQAHDAAAVRAALVPLGLTPPDPTLEGDEREPLVVDVGLGQDVTQYVLAVSVDPSGQVLEISMES